VMADVLAVSVAAYAIIDDLTCSSKLPLRIFA
jgi:hypothetical protein